MLRNIASLATFVQVARQLSFTKAGKILNLSQGAVSVQIKQLEQELGFTLFHRKVRKIFLTKEGERLLKAVEPALDRIERSIKSIRSTGDSGQLTVSTLASFAAKWLIPRIVEFRREQPQLTIRIHTGEKPVDFHAEQVDCAIRFGKGNYPGMNTTYLTDEIYFAVCHPDLRGSSKPLADPGEIGRYTLLHDVCQHEDCNYSWEQWAVRSGVEDLDLDSGLQFYQSDYAIQAAIAGQGVALARMSLVENDLENGILVPLFRHRLDCNYSYYFVHPEESSGNPDIELFKQWILEQMQSLRRAVAKS